jgi:N-acetylglutamate synthase-like GNAT family acetyltransferase
VDTVLPVDVYVPGCAARPESIIDGILQAVEILEKKHAYMKSMHGRMKEMTIGRATAVDAPEILALQKIVYQNEAEMYDDWSLAPLRQTLDDLRRDFETRVFIKAVVGGKIIGSVKGIMDGDTAHLSRLVVHPYFWKQGIGTRLVQEVEASFPKAKRFETFTGQKSRHTMEPYQRLGYLPIRQEKVSEHRDRVYFGRDREGA